MPRNRRADEAPSWGGRLTFVLALVAYAFVLQFTSGHLASVDGYYHIRYAALLRQAGWHGFPPEFPWLPLTVLSADRYFDHHMLFHLWLVPFAGGDPISGAKIAAAIGAAAAFVSPYLLLSRQGVRHAHWWTIGLLALAPAFLYRMEMPRAQAWAVVFLVAALALLFAERDAWFLPLGWLFAWSYDAFPALLAVTTCAVAARALLTGSLSPRPLGYALAGVFLALLINPYFPASLVFVWHHFAGKLDALAPPGGAEWNPFPVAEWVGWGGLIALLAAAAALLVRLRTALDPKRLTAVLAALVFLALAWRWSRFVEYLVPLAGIAAALCLHERAHAAVRRLAPRRRRVLAAAMVLWLTGSTVLAARQIAGRPAADRHRRASHWVAGHSPSGSLVFNANWDDFPLLFFHNPSNAYVIGLDPTYLARRSPALYERWRRLRAGEEAQPARVLREEFGVRLAVTDRRPRAFIAAMDGDPRAVRAYEDEDSIVYRVLSDPPEPAP